MIHATITAAALSCAAITTDANLEPVHASLVPAMRGPSPSISSEEAWRTTCRPSAKPSPRRPH